MRPMWPDQKLPPLAGILTQIGQGTRLMQGKVLFKELTFGLVAFIIIKCCSLHSFPLLKRLDVKKFNKKPRAALTSLLRLHLC